jgi:hypothetical protein
VVEVEIGTVIESKQHGSVKVASPVFVGKWFDPSLFGRGETSVESDITYGVHPSLLYSIKIEVEVNAFSSIADIEHLANSSRTNESTDLRIWKHIRSASAKCAGIYLRAKALPAVSMAWCTEASLIVIIISTCTVPFVGRV